MPININQYSEKMDKTIDNFKIDLNTIRAGRANPHVLDKIIINYYGVDTPVNQVGNITVPEARVLQIQPWDVSIIKEIEKSIFSSDLGINPTNDGKVVRIIFPELTEERRKSITKDVKKRGEESKIAIRNIRRDGMDNFKKLQKIKEITEDELNNLENSLQKLTDKYILEIDKLVDAKNKDILSI